MARMVLSSREFLRKFLFLGLILGVVPIDAFAQDPVEKLGRGGTSVLSGWIEIPVQIERSIAHNGPAAGFMRGLGRGAQLTFLRMGVGLYEIATFVVPYPAKFASPYASMGLPEYAWEEEYDWQE